MERLTVENFRKSFDGSKQVLKGISFEMHKGEVLAIIGSSGSGKTTLLRCLNFLETPDAGKMTLDGQTLFDADEPRPGSRELRRRRLHFGLVFQNFNLFPQYTVLENLCLAPKLLLKEQPDYRQIKKARFKEIEAQAMELLDRVGLADRQNSYPSQLSGGQQQRVAIARALILSPDILCFDEPTSALDPELTAEVLEVMRGLAAKHVTMIVVTHEMTFAREVADRIIFMDQGVVAADGRPDEIFAAADGSRLQAFLGSIAK